MTTQHTPGQWVEVDGRIFASGYALTGAPIATVHSRKKNGMQKANACLIAAAPELLEASKLANHLLSGSNMNREVVERKVRAAIAKAEGGAA